MTNGIIAFGVHFITDDHNVTGLASLSGNNLVTIAEFPTHWTLFAQNSPMRLDKDSWKICKCGDHQIVLVNNKNELVNFNFDKQEFVKCAEIGIQASTIQLFDYQCAYGVSIAGDENESDIKILLNRDLQFSICTEIKFPHVIVEISCGKEHVVLLNAAGSVFTLGSNIRGQLGCGGNELVKTFTPTPVDLLLGQRISAISAGGWHSLAVDTESNAVYSWGWNESGQLGHELGGSVPADLPSIIDLFDSNGNCIDAIVVKVACGSRHSVILAIVNNNKCVFTFGSNIFGQLGRQQMIATDGDYKYQFDWRPLRIDDEDSNALFGSHTNTVVVHDVFAFGCATALITSTV